jgi:hypothetical protein
MFAVGRYVGVEGKMGTQWETATGERSVPLKEYLQIKSFRNATASELVGIDVAQDRAAFVIEFEEPLRHPIRLGEWDSW